MSDSWRAHRSCQLYSVDVRRRGCGLRGGIWVLEGTRGYSRFFWRITATEGSWLRNRHPNKGFRRALRLSATIATPSDGVATRLTQKQHAGAQLQPRSLHGPSCGRAVQRSVAGRNCYDALLHDPPAAVNGAGWQCTVSRASCASCADRAVCHNGVRRPSGE